MSRSRKARFDRYPHHHIWWLKNVRFAPRRLSPRERTASISDQIDEHLSDAHQARLLERKVQRELQEADVMFDGWRDFEDSAWLDFEDDPYEDRDYEDRNYECSYADHDRVVEEEVTETDPRWVDEYLLGADTGLEERNDRYDSYFDDDDDDLYDSCERDFWDAWPSHDALSNAPFDIAEHRERERLKAGDRYYRSHR